MAIFTPRGLKIRLPVNEVFALISRLYPKVNAFEVLKTTEGMESIPSLITYIIGLICFYLRLSIIEIGFYVFFASIIGFLLTPVIYKISGLVRLGTVYSYISGFGLLLFTIIVSGFITVGWQGLAVFFLAKFLSEIIEMASEGIQTKLSNSKNNRILTGSEISFFNAYRLHAIRLGVTTDTYVSKDELIKESWLPVYEDLVKKWPKIVERFTNDEDYENNDGENILSLEIIKQRWKEVIMYLKVNKHMGIAVILIEVIPIKYQKNVITVTFKPNLNYYYELICDKKNKEIIDITIKKIFGDEITIEFTNNRNSSHVDYRDQIKKLGWIVHDGLVSYISVHDKIFHEAATFKSFIKNIIGINIKWDKLLEEAKKLIPLWNSIQYKIEEFKTSNYSCLTIDEKYYIDILSRYVKALRKTVAYLIKRQRLAERVRKGNLASATWRNFSIKEKEYKTTIEEYLKIGQELKDAADIIY
ncbi:MAG: hypothetical protein PHV30_05300 [Candidatus Margulisbacteria bacterium]|nr:hypothetical protein [Candidatus Margulisiibacteriota bacterium]